MTIEHAYNDYVKKLGTIYETRESFNIADWVFESVAGVKRLDRITDKHKLLDALYAGKLAGALEDLLQHKPVQYVLGEAWWYKMKFFVNENVLIPRPETEELVKWITVLNVQIENKRTKIIDIGTGSGCIAIALKKELPAATIIAIDVSAGALQIAKQNAATQNTPVELLQLDFLNEDTWYKLASFDIIVSNPPYVPAEEKIKLPDNVVRFEPGIALFAPTGEPFIFYKKIALFAKLHLNNDGKIFVEIHEELAAEVKNIFSKNGFKTSVKKDIYGKDRMICAYR